MNLLQEFAGLGIRVSSLTKKKQQTTKKIEYVREYVNQWAIISAERDNVQSINFVDCMCNAGVYQDGDCCTAIEVLLVFSELCLKYPQKDFCIFCNDIDSVKISVLEKLIAFLPQAKMRNLHVYIENKDVNEYLDSLAKNKPIEGRYVFGYGNSTVLYVDPFDFGTVEIPKVSAILEKHYCELIFNFFLSDYVRNIQHDNGRISKCVGGEKFNNKDELIAYVQSKLKVGKIKFSFAYQFKISSNVELYQIIFATPSIRGLEVLKEALWKVFKGAQFHRNKVETGQMCMFSTDDDMKESLKAYAREAIGLLQYNYSGCKLSYAEIEVYLIENTMLKETQIIKNVIQPMIVAGEMKKCGLCRVNNFKNDEYQIL